MAQEIPEMKQQQQQNDDDDDKTQVTQFPDISLHIHSSFFAV